ncbi:DegV family EDD domain-containing protein [Nocardioides guangzhouensis]|uniref:DegV family EDD domain-containing protein n=1 Tax=Nocardioides guangzhouensis TaxID=2497878 RepID=A0A4Q4ZGR1_9ACTN|nr:DegV family protein [Nocardioides guangzhouensis]RYP86514.1 DegV family EDD domain-containing protein [Nocardioides guangzhouensis]
MTRVAIVTDSSASLPDGVAEELGVVVVPLQVVIGATSYDEDEATTDMVAEALRSFTPVSTSRPTPAAMAEVYAAAAARGAEAIVSIHLSRELSGTFDSAEVAARDSSVPVLAVDGRQVGHATGYAVMAAARVAATGASAEEVAAAARARADASTSLFYVDTLEYLRRGGRVGAAAALIGGALAVKPLLGLEDGRIVSLEKVRTAGKALARLEDLAVESADGAKVEATVAHLASPDRAEQLGARLSERLDLVTPVRIAELGAVLGAHVGPGMVSVCVAPALD